MKKRIVINITSSATWNGHPVGIIRVEREITRHLYQMYPDRIVPVFLNYVGKSSDEHKIWNAKNVKLRAVKPECFQKIVSDSWVLGDKPDRVTEMQSQLGAFHPSSEDTFITVGSDWAFNVPEIVGHAYGEKRVMISACYDLIPLLINEFTSGRESYDQFNHHYANVARFAKSVFAISENTKRTLLDYWDSKGVLKSAPPVEVVPLAALAGSEKLPVLNDGDQASLENILREGRYIIYVSTLEPRKNHQLLLEIWRELYAERGKNCPQLLLVGRRGWGSWDLTQQMARMKATQARKIVWLEGAGDELLAHLYSQALFAVFPSYYEGWGLAATEAAAFGKVCVVSNNSALHEATYGLMPSYHPLDFPGWLREMRQLIDDDAYRMELEQRTAKHNFKRTWADFGNDFCEKLLGRLP